MKKALSLVLFLGLLLLTTALTSKKDSLVKRINNAFKMFSIANFVEEYTPSKYAEKLLDEDLEVDGLSIKIQLVRDSISAVLDHLGFEEGVILKVAAAKVSQLMDSMDLFVGIALGQKEAKDFVDLVGFIPDLTDVTTFNNKLKDGDKVKDAIDFIKDIIHPDSVVNKKPAKRTAGKSSRTKKMLEAEEESLVEANQKLNKDKEEALDDDLSTGDDDDAEKDTTTTTSAAAAPLERKTGKDSGDCTPGVDCEDGDDDGDKMKDDEDILDKKPIVVEDDTPKRKSVVPVVPAPKRKLSHRKKNGRASKTNILGNFVEVPTAKRITKEKKETKDNSLDTLLDEPTNREDGNTMKNDNGDGELMKPEGDDFPLKEDDGALKDTTPLAPIEAKKGRRMSGKKNQKIKGLTRKALKKRIKPSFMTEEEIKAHEKNELSDNFSFISLREDNKTGLKNKKTTKHEAKVHRKATACNPDDDDCDEGDDDLMKGKENLDNGDGDKLDEQLNGNDDGEGLKGNDDPKDESLNDIPEIPSARKAHKHRRF